MSTQGQAWVDKVGILSCKNAGELLVLIRVSNHVGGDMRGCFAKAATLAKESLMGESTVLKHLRSLRAAGVLLPGDEKLVDHIRADKRPPVYDLAGGHEKGCPGGHPSDLLCETVMATGVQIEHPAGRRSPSGARSEHPKKSPRSTGARSEHPKRKPSSAGARSEHPTTDAGGTGDQIDASRVLDSSGRSSKELKLSPLSLPAGALNRLRSQDQQAVAEERENLLLPEPRSEALPSVQLVLDAYTGALGPVRPQRSVLDELTRDAEELLALNWPVEHLADLAAQMPGLRYTSLATHARYNPPPAPKAAPTRDSAMCERHPAFPADDCLRCLDEERQRARREHVAPATVDGAGLLARLRANQPVS
ncbi:hypothetical protein [Streptomyces albidoflavus]|uniref:hypothetical protein n=1 Tax=Streptomyces albidoflavus TaxID=1886 RepID=UPI0033F4F626